MPFMERGTIIYQNHDNDSTGFEIPLIGGSIKDKYDSLGKMIEEMNQSIDSLKTKENHFGIEIEKKFEELCSTYDNRIKKLEDLIQLLNDKNNALFSNFKTVEDAQKLYSDSVIKLGGKLKEQEEKIQSQATNLEIAYKELEKTNESKVRFLEDLIKGQDEKNNLVLTSITNQLSDMKIIQQNSIEISKNENKEVFEKISILEKVKSDTAYWSSSLLTVDYLKLLRTWTGKNNFTLIFRGTRDGMNATSFHSFCNNRGATITVMKNNNGIIFGGYTPESWTSRGSFINTTGSWVFSLSSSEKYGHNGSYYGYAVYDNGSNGPTFGSYDIKIHSDFASNGNLSNKHTYNIPNNYTFTGSYNFKLEEIEVFIMN